MSACSSCTTSQVSLGDYSSANMLTWCPGCGNFGIQVALKQALVACGVTPHQAMLCFDIGCNGNGSDKIGGYRYHGLHGRVIPLAAGITCANPSLTVVAEGGDGALLGEGVNHLVHAIRGNFDMTLLLHNNENYGLTTGQASATTRKGVKMNSTPDGVTAEVLHPQRFALSLGVTFSARVFSGDIKMMNEVFAAAIKHKGFSFVEILQNCPTYNKTTPHEWYQQRVYNVNTNGYDPSNRAAAFVAAEDIDEKVAVGILYQDTTSTTYMERQSFRSGKQTHLYQEVQRGDIKPFTDRLR